MIHTKLRIPAQVESQGPIWRQIRPSNHLGVLIDHLRMPKRMLYTSELVLICMHKEDSQAVSHIDVCFRSMRRIHMPVFMCVGRLCKTIVPWTWVGGFLCGAVQMVCLFGTSSQIQSMRTRAQPAYICISSIHVYSLHTYVYPIYTCMACIHMYILHTRV